MRYLHEKAGFVLRVAVLGLLLGAQNFSLAHEMGHLGAGDASLCAVCSIGTGLDSPVHVEHQVPDPSPAIPVVNERLVRVILKVIATPLTARAPPRTC